jgi:hypothetical protein
MISTRIREARKSLRRSYKWRNFKASVVRLRSGVILVLQIALGVALGLLLFSIAAPFLAG